jgi:hypothetical protein
VLSSFGSWPSLAAANANAMVNGAIFSMFIGSFFSIEWTDESAFLHPRVCPQPGIFANESDAYAKMDAAFQGYDFCNRRCSVRLVCARPHGH